MITALQIYKEAKALDSTATLAQVQTALNGIDRPAHEAAEQSRYRIELWDKTSPINGVPAERIKGNDYPAGGEVYLIFVDGNLVFLQKHDPDQMGFVPMTAQSATAKAQAQIDKMVEQTIDQKVMDECLVQLL